MDMNLPDEELQHRIEQRVNQTSTDGLAYQKVFDALATEPEFRLPMTFADKVLIKLDKREALAATKEMYWLAAGIFLLVIAALVGALLIGFKPSFGIFGFLASYPGLFVFGILFVGLLQWLDKRLVKKPTL
jgi:hypothetical protein